jgi:hypothetical protein
MAVNTLLQFLTHERGLDVQRAQEKVRQQAEKSRIVKRIMDSNLRIAGIAYRQAHQHTAQAREKERVLVNRQQGIMRRILDSNVRLIAQGYNKLLETSQANKNVIKNKMRNLIKSLKDKELGFVIAAYNGLVQRARMLGGEGMGIATMKKVGLVKRLMNKGHNMQIMAVNGIKEFLRVERLLDDAEVERMLAQAKEKERILRRIMDSNLRMSGIAYRQAHHYTVETRKKERV